MVSLWLVEAYLWLVYFRVSVESYYNLGLGLALDLVSNSGPPNFQSINLGLGLR